MEYSRFFTEKKSMKEILHLGVRRTSKAKSAVPRELSTLKMFWNLWSTTRQCNIRIPMIMNFGSLQKYTFDDLSPTENSRQLWWNWMVSHSGSKTSTVVCANQSSQSSYKISQFSDRVFLLRGCLWSCYSRSSSVHYIGSVCSLRKYK